MSALCVFVIQVPIERCINMYIYNAVVFVEHITTAEPSVRFNKDSHDKDQLLSS